MVLVLLLGAPNIFQKDLGFLTTHCLHPTF